MRRGSSDLQCRTASCTISEICPASALQAGIAKVGATSPIKWSLMSTYIATPLDVGPSLGRWGRCWTVNGGNHAILVPPHPPGAPGLNKSYQNQILRNISPVHTIFDCLSDWSDHLLAFQKSPGCICLRHALPQDHWSFPFLELPYLSPARSTDLPHLLSYIMSHYKPELEVTTDIRQSPAVMCCCCWLSVTS